MKEYERTVLSAGRAPACWQRELIQQTAQSQRLHHLCSWLKPFTENQRKLRDGPLWGDCLAELTAQVVQPERSSLETSQTRRDWAPWPDMGAHRRQKPDQMGERSTRARSNVSIRRPSVKAPRQQPSPDSLPQPVKLVRQAKQNVLNRLAGETQQSLSNVISMRPLSEQAVSLRDRSIMANTRDIKSQRNWLFNIARRACRSLDMAGFQTFPPLDKQWSIRLDGEPAPLGLLIRWLGQPSGKGIHSDRQMKVGAMPHQSSSLEPNTHQAAHEIASSSNELTRAPLPVAGWKDDVESEWVSSDRIAPPVVAPFLPPLLPPQVVGEPTPALAAMITRQDARHEAMKGEDNLASLAANIKRILDEEARRHGIEV